MFRPTIPLCPKQVVLQRRDLLVRFLKYNRLNHFLISSMVPSVVCVVERFTFILSLGNGRRRIVVCVRIIRKRGSLITGSPLIRCPPFYIVCPTRSLVPFPNQSGIINRSRIHLFLQPFLPCLVSRHLQLLPVVRIRHMRLPPFNHRQRIYLPKGFLRLSHNYSRSRSVLNVLNLTCLCTNVTMVCVGRLFQYSRIHLQRLVRVSDIQPCTQRVKRRVIHVLRTINVNRIGQVRGASLNHRTSNHLLTRAFPINLCTRSVERTLQIVSNRRIHGNLIVLRNQKRCGVCHLKVVRYSERTFRQTSLHPNQKGNRHRSGEAGDFRFECDL